MFLPVWIGRFEVTGPRDNPALDGFPSAFVWVSAQAASASALEKMVTSSMKKSGLAVIKSEAVEKVDDDTKLSVELRKLIRESRRHPNTVICGKWHRFESAAAQRSTLLELKTERLILRPWHRNDRDAFAEMNADREVMAFSAPMSRRQSDEEVDRYLADFAQYGFSFLVAESFDRKDSTVPRAFAGILGLQLMRDIIPGVPQPAIEIGWRLNRAHQGRGLATEGARAILNFAFHDIMLPEVVAITAVANTASRRVMEKLGMTHRADIEFNHPRLPPKHLYSRHTLYQLENPLLSAPLTR